MKSWDELTDDELLAALGEAVAEDRAVDERRRAAAYGAFAWRRVDDELAELLHDSALDAGAAVRSSVAAPRALAFGSTGLTLELEVDGEQVLGEVVAAGGADAGAAPTTVVLQRPDADAATTEVDAAGFFRFDGVTPGPARFVVERGGRSLTTPWVTI
ncbi:hypothetical protein [Nocardioides sp. TF02-7]|uniref:hypothetical protein n=1 Tax=Nocardioides sp. TF02-7 TaxID=2917724 RepID=UPI001F0613FE|nr:hypothetical protein [Nocardioides sp. TF02-7]UMG94040.1 hypothetical protein MF408_08265 [Nocardioides sp. TF02-7]